MQNRSKKCRLLIFSWFWFAHLKFFFVILSPSRREVVSFTARRCLLGGVKKASLRRQA